MTTVDDLVISLRIDDTSNLGNLQKQLDALVGKKGEKGVEIGLDATLKRDLQEIKDRIIKFTPSVLLDTNVKEAAFALASDLKKDANLRDVMLQRYNISIDKYEAFIEELFNISLGISKQNSDQSKGFIAEMAKFRAIATMAGGQRETLVKRLTKMMLEAGFHEKLVDIFREAGVKMLSKPKMYELTTKSTGKFFEDAIKEFKEKDKVMFDALKKIFDDNTDMLKATSEAYKFMKKKVFDITEVTQDMIRKDDDLLKIILAQVASIETKSNWMVEQFYIAGKGFFTGGERFGVKGPAELDTVIHRVSKTAFDELGIEHVFGTKISELSENFVGELKTVLGKSEISKETLKRAIAQGYTRIAFFFEEFTEDAKNFYEEFVLKGKHKGIQISGYKLTARTIQKLLGIETDLDELQETTRKSLEEVNAELETKLLTEAEKKADLEGMEEFFMTGEEGGKELTGEVNDLTKTVEKGFLDAGKKLMGIDGKEKEILDRMKAKEAAKLNKPDIEEDEGGE